MNQIYESFLSEHAIVRTVSVLCKALDGPDPISTVLANMLASNIHYKLNSVGIQLFQGKELTYPYNMMVHEQKAALRAALEIEDSWTVYEYAISANKATHTGKLKPIHVLYPVCKHIIDESLFEDKRHRVAVCNIILQRVQASIPLDKTTQSELNKRLFSYKNTVSEEATSEHDNHTVQSQ